MRDFITLLDYSPVELTALLDRADELAAAWHEGKMPRSLEGRQVGLWFYGQGFRNRVAFEIGARAMGASVSYIPGELGIQEPLEDMGGYLDNWYDVLVARARDHDQLCALADGMSVPVVNARTDRGHPCEILGDLQYIRRYRGTLEGLEVLFYGEVTNLCASWFEAAARFPIRVTQVAPPDWLVTPERLVQYKATAVGDIRTREEGSDLLDRADVLYTDCWPRTAEESEKARIAASFLPCQITAEMVSRLHEEAFFLPCPPVTRGQEVSDEAMQSPRCRNREAKAFLLHAQNAVLEKVLAAGESDGRR